MLTIVELPEYLRQAEKLLAEQDRVSICTTLAKLPTCGVLITGTGGIRKLRWARPGMGKSGGVRVIYYFHDWNMPLFLLTLFPKSEQSDLSAAQRNALADLARLLRSQYRGK